VLSGCYATINSQFRAVTIEEVLTKLNTPDVNNAIQSQASGKITYLQPVNKPTPCQLPIVQNVSDWKNVRAFWEGKCRNGYVSGYGRSLVVSDDHHIEEITTYVDDGKIRNVSSVYFDFKNQYVNYRFIGEDNFVKYSFKEVYSGEAEEFDVKYHLAEYDNGELKYHIEASEFNPKTTLTSAKKALDLKYQVFSIEPNTTYDLGFPVFLFNTVKVGAVVGYEISKFANGRVDYTDLGSSERVILPKEYVDLVKKEYRDILRSKDRISKKYEAAKKLEHEYLIPICNERHNIQGLKNIVSQKICQWRDQYATPYTLAFNAYENYVIHLRNEASIRQNEVKTQKTIEEARGRRRNKRAKANATALVAMVSLYQSHKALSKVAKKLGGVDGNIPVYGKKRPSGYVLSPPVNPQVYVAKTGRKFQYDLSNPVLRRFYNADPLARLRDRIDPSPLRRIEHIQGQHGGGILKEDAIKSIQWPWLD